MNSTQIKILLGILGIFVLIIGGLFFAYRYYVNNGGGNGQVTREGGGLFPDSGIFGGFGREDEARDGQDGPVPTLRHITEKAVAGGVVFLSEETVAIRYVERATGHVFETALDSLEEKRLSNTTIPRIQEAVWSPDGESVILRYLDENENLKSFYGAIEKESGTLDGWFLDNRILNIASNEEGNIFYIQRVGNEGQGISSNFDGTNGRAVLSSSVYDWRAQWAGDSVMLASVSSNGIPGFLYELESGRLTAIIGGDGLSTLASKDGSMVLFSTSNTDGTTLFVYDRKSKKTTQVPFRTLAEKCAWATPTVVYCASPYAIDRNAVYPDDWYKGAVSFSDDIWLYDIGRKQEQLVYDAEAEGKIFDATNLSIDKDVRSLFFINKKDMTPWVLLLERP